ncbi:hypothetical protein [Allomesorhizobium alhagi]|uniref:Uncharacterized protein n=1 Tax=Mesorhizobium alhagi CCNWXJ12-2 TaxID=1107882 RepID=H0I117_9HYPH|nr:hypothetical protein [Mesorhizobium alhagi]EHK53310.1 hypothetical protein MAXJ12_30772 [Mesorhizobium alhagi CCNWXJ12-2]
MVKNLLDAVMEQAPRVVDEQLSILGQAGAIQAVDAYWEETLKQ